ncbi:MAG TPA: M23 family metallopeptidase [Gaiellaceae bacterium]|nr:M23 family metallopeptidase [Gaiellaceae bacterium]
MATNSHTPRRGARRRTIVFLALVSIAGAACTAAVAAGTQRSSTSTSGGYGWPIKPFDRQHPVRGVFADPRTSFVGPPTRVGLHGPGEFSYHQGVDISAPAGTAVYPVRSGVVHLRSRETVVVTSDAGDAFEYWHIVPSVREGQRVTAFESVLGRIRPGEYEHVHLTELEGGHPVNPLASGRLTPFEDHTAPAVGSATYLDARNGRDVLPEFAHGQIQLVVSATDTPAMAVPGRWSGLPVVPARLTWRIERTKDGKVVVAEHEAFDARERLPTAPFWQTYVRGTRQNTANFAGHKMWRQPGVYLFRLTGSFDTKRLPDDIYVLVATATDTRGNAGTGRFVFTIHNKPGFFSR